ncbi:MAG: DMT family transporter [Alphaproteobacteria bacterium]
MFLIRAIAALPDGAKGMVLMTLGIGVITVNDALMKLANEGLPIGETMAIRAAFVWIPILIFASRAGGRRALRVYDWPRQLARGACLVFSSWCYFYGLRELQLAEVIAIAAVGPLFLTMMAGPLLGEHVGWRRWTAVMVGFVGALVVIRPGGADFAWAALFPLGSAIAGAGRDILQRKMSLGREGTVAILAVSTTCVGLSGAVTIPFVWQTPSLGQLTAIGVAGLLMGTAHYLMIEALRLAEASSIAPLRYTTFLWGAFWGFTIWGELPAPATWIGVAIIAASGIYILHRETARRQETPPRKEETRDAAQ